MNTKVVFRTDASLQIGTGHVMRCLTLADALAARGADCEFICRAHHGNLTELIRNKGFGVHVLPNSSPAVPDSCVVGVTFDGYAPAHCHWLGATQVQDAEACAEILAELRPDWLIVDHYALDARWELALRPYCRKLMVIDDLADRAHRCDVLLDQTFGREKADYYGAWVSADCRLLCGSQYALLRPEFAALRAESLQRRQQPTLRKVLVSLGGVDRDNFTGRVSYALSGSDLPLACELVVVMGRAAPWLETVRQQAARLPFAAEVLVGTDRMANLMANADLAIGAAGTTTWERCCLGLPSIMLTVADNQRYAADKLGEAGAAWVLDGRTDFSAQLRALISHVVDDSRALIDLGHAAAAVTDGAGCQRVADIIAPCA